MRIAFLVVLSLVASLSRLADCWLIPGGDGMLEMSEVTSRLVGGRDQEVWKRDSWVANMM